MASLLSCPLAEAQILTPELVEVAQTDNESVPVPNLEAVPIPAWFPELGRNKLPVKVKTGLEGL